jgi:hypothetical protein
METKINMNNALIMKKSKIFCDNGNCNGGRAFRVANSVKWFCGPCCLNKGLNLKPTDEDYWTDEYCDCDDCKKNRKNKKKKINIWKFQ